MKRLDLILIAGVLVLAGVIYLVFLGSAEDGGKAVITVDGQVVQELPLDEDTTYRVETPEGYNIVEIKDGWADVIEADCRDGLCADQKRVRKTGETIVCLPHKMVVTIEAGTENTVDAVVG
ncbi:NusG domain II-containing protein [Anaerotignum sp.]|uniref:NusG domain II-containing protein n=1 Tax=Anaerotignum sp. TaxID=2039241 RepID=UPI003736D0D9